MMLAHIFEHLLMRPVRQGTDLHETAMHRIDRDLSGIGSVEILIPAQTRDISVESSQMTPHRLDLPRAAARLSVLDRFVKAVHAFFADELLDGFGVREDHLHLLVVSIANAVDQVIGGGMHAPGIEDEDAGHRIDLMQHIDQNHALGRTEGRRKREAWMKFPDRLSQDIFRGRRFELIAPNQLQNLVFEGFSIKRIHWEQGHTGSWGPWAHL